MWAEALAHDRWSLSSSPGSHFIGSEFDALAGQPGGLGAVRHIRQHDLTLAAAGENCDIHPQCVARVRGQNAGGALDGYEDFFNRETEDSAFARQLVVAKVMLQIGGSGDD